MKKKKEEPKIEVVQEVAEPIKEVAIKVGRPPFVLDDHENTSFSDAAALAGMNLDQWMRDRLRVACVRELENTPKKTTF